MDFGAGICNEGIRWRDIVIGGVVAQLDQIIGSVALEDDGHSHMRAGQFSSIKLPMNADGPISWPSIIPITLSQRSERRLTRDTCHFTITTNNMQGWP